LGVLSAVLFWWGFSHRGPSWPKTVIKTLPLAVLTGISVVEGLPALLIVGLALSALGDFALSRPGQRAFLVGLISFALAHIAYIAVFAGVLASTWVLPPLWIMAVVVGLVVPAIPAFWRHAGALKGPVAVYMILIAAMVLTAGMHTDGGMTLVAGAVMFALSDFLLGVQMFRNLPPAWNAAASLVIWPLYILGQVGIFFGVAMATF